MGGAKAYDNERSLSSLYHSIFSVANVNMYNTLNLHLFPVTDHCRANSLVCLKLFVTSSVHKYCILPFFVHCTYILPVKIPDNEPDFPASVINRNTPLTNTILTSTA